MSQNVPAEHDDHLVPPHCHQIIQIYPILFRHCDNLDHKGPSTLQLKLEKSCYRLCTLQLFFSTARMIYQFFWKLIHTIYFRKK